MRGPEHEAERLVSLRSIERVPALFTIDFHNTLFHCDAWFQLEIRELPRAVFAEMNAISPGEDNHQMLTEALQRYRAIREQAMASGVECDAVTSMIQVAHELELVLRPDDIASAVQSVMHRAQHDAQPIPGAIELLQGVRARGIQIAVISSAAYHPFLEWSLTRFDMSDLIDEVVTSARCGIYKSNPAIYQHTLDLFNASAATSVHVGDSPRFDVASASSIGMKTVLLSNDLAATLDPEPDLVVASLGEVPEHLDRLLTA